MTLNEFCFRSRYTAKYILSLKTIRILLESFGSLWLLVEISTYFLGDSSTVVIKIKSLWYLFLIIGVVLSIIKSVPKFRFGSKLSNRDIYIEIVVGDLFNQEGALIIGTNTTFDTHVSRELISPRSIQGQFTQRYYGDETQLNNELSSVLRNIEFETLSDERLGNKKKYPIGTTVRLNPKKRTAYMIAIANINPHGVASGTFEELKKSLAFLWNFISRKGLKENLVMPILGSGFTRLMQSREEIIREIIKSFVAACAESTFCDKLSIVISQKDIDKNNIQLEELERFIHHICTYTIFSNNSTTVGNPA